MNIGDTFEINLGYRSELNQHRFKVVKIYPDSINTKKDLLICKEIDLGYKECFFRMDLEGDANVNNKLSKWQK